ncbi:MAG: hemin uptake protein HemP [Polaromonas sp.]|nr:hemin uptake protein HemP [Polaromonas sp.]
MSLALPNSHTLSLPSTSAKYALRLKAATNQSTAGAPSGGMSSNEILRGQKAVEINHNGSTYRLQATRLGKLILTK